MDVLEEDGIFLNLRSKLLTFSIKVLETQVNAKAFCSKEWPNKLYWVHFCHG